MIITDGDLAVELQFVQLFSAAGQGQFRAAEQSAKVTAATRSQRQLGSVDECDATYRRLSFSDIVS